MASAQTPVAMTSELAVRQYVHVPADADTDQAIAWVDMRDFEHFLCSVAVVVASVVTFRILVSGSSTGADTPVVVRAHAAPTTADAVGDTLYLECTSQELAALATATCVKPRYVSVWLDMDTATDDAVVTYIRYGGKRTAGLTADQIA